MSIIDFDVQIFIFINESWSNPVFDTILPIMRNKYIWAPLYVFLVGFFVFNFRKQALLFILFAGLNVASTDIISSHLIKKSVKRVRPCNQQENLDVRLLVDCGSGYSFTSSHAANHFGVASFLFFVMGFMLGHYKYLLLIWAALISYAQVYVGVHFPLDIIFGALVGFFIGSTWAELYSLALKKLKLG